ncbi:ABC transporter substrate-binding protein [Bordetella genomosp. 7]|jgi:tripartite-type tricarboxylate transporter receptor subunit TctC|uniref:ABC transporter substrate-binding protein n=1 Tax=Bordetella genomosp. 7 TaxID=1416805 RepID=A0A261RI53_9BORD|nr:MULTISPECIES: tripartite tricarboxylate transporter substrate binding protein [Bordetella]OZI24716.1 ABC transporter substrate-binding protein [Bordetella genomosp. 7]OZI27754.1 ABC transporter substrate-binding protein [Bordetella genomosp. 7]
MKRFQKLALTLAAATAWAMPAAAQEIPGQKQMRLIVPYSAGGTSDILGRKLAEQLSARLQRPVIVENKAGAGGAIGTEATVRADADGSTILLHSGAIATEPAIKAKLPYDVTRDLMSITTVVRGPFALLVSNDLPVKNVADLVKYAQANPEKVNFGTPGIGTSVHFASELFKSAAKAPVTHVPYKGASAALTGLMGGEVQMVIDPLSTAKRYAEGGKVKALAITTAQRSDLWPGMTTVAESGVPGFNAAVWYGLYVPAKTPAATVQMLNKEFVAILQSPEMREWLTSQGLEAVGDTPQQAQDQLVEEIKTWKELARTAGIQPQ